MKYVIDASVAFKWEVAEPLSDKARQLRDDFKQTTHELIAPDLLLPEVANALLVSERRGRIVAGDGKIMLGDFLTALPVLYPSYPDLGVRAFTIAAMAGASVYDCLYIALAEREHCDHITADDKLVRKVQPQFPWVRHLSTLP